MIGNIRHLFGGDKYTETQIIAEYREMFKKEPPVSLILGVKKITNEQKISLRDAILDYMNTFSLKLTKKEKEHAYFMYEKRVRSTDEISPSLWMTLLFFEIATGSVVIAEEELIEDKDNDSGYIHSTATYPPPVVDGGVNTNHYLSDSISSSNDVIPAYSNDFPVISDVNTSIVDSSGSGTGSGSGSGSGSGCSGSGSGTGSGSGSGSGCSGSGSGCGGS